MSYLGEKIKELRSLSNLSQAEPGGEETRFSVLGGLAPRFPNRPRGARLSNIVLLYILIIGHHIR